MLELFKTVIDKSSRVEYGVLTINFSREPFKMKGLIYNLQVTGAILCTIGLILMAYYKWGMEKLNDVFEDNKPALFKTSAGRTGIIIATGLFILAGLGFLYIPVFLFYR